MQGLGTLSLLAGIAFLTGCGGGGGGGGDPSGLTTYTCALPCLKAAPVVSPATVSRGGTVTVSFEIEGNFADLDNVYVTLSHVSENRGAGAVFVPSPPGPVVTVDIVVDADAAEGTYYPDIFLQTNAGDYGQYVLATDHSETKYLYGQTIGTTETHALSPITVPRITVTP